MISIHKVVSVLREGGEDCNHTFLKSPFMKGFALHPLSHEQEQICFHCGHHEHVIHTLARQAPFTFEAALKRFSN